MSCKALAVAVLLVAGVACQRARTPGGVPRLAVLRFENLTPDASLDWMGRGFSEALIAQWAGSPRLYAIPSQNLHGLDAVLGARPLATPGISSERGAALLAGATRLVYGEYSLLNGQLRAHAEVEDAETGRILLTAAAAGPRADGMIPLAGRLARELEGGAARPLGTRRDDALRDYVSALEAPDSSTSAPEFARALEADPDFGLAYVTWAEAELRRQDRAGAQKVIERGLARGQTLRELDRARLAFLDASLRADAAAAARALGTLSALAPLDPSLYRAAAEFALERRNYPAAVEGLRRAADIEPSNVETLNTLGYAQAYSGDLEGATRTLRQYASLRPREANPLDSLGDVHLYNGRYEEAAKFYQQAYQNDPNFLNGGTLVKSAEARLMAGDWAGADSLFRQLLDRLKAAGDPLVSMREADWLWTTGRRRQGAALLERFAAAAEGGASREAASRAWAELAVWQLSLGNRDAARAAADRAMAHATPASAPVAVVARFLCEPPAAAAEWSQRADKVFARAPAVRGFTLAYALLFGRYFQEAAPLLRQIYGSSTPQSQGSLPVLLAWAEEESGGWQEAARLLRFTPIPPATGLDAFASLWFPRLFYLRARLADHDGRRDDARRQFALFARLSGPDGLIWGEEKQIQPQSHTDARR